METETETETGLEILIKHNQLSITIWPISMNC